MAEIVIPGGCGCCGPVVSFTNFVFQVWYKITCGFTKTSDGDGGVWSYITSATFDFLSEAPRPPVQRGEFERTSLLAIGGGALQGGMDHDSTDPSDWITLQTINAPSATFYDLPDGNDHHGSDGVISYGQHFQLASDFTTSFVYDGATYDIIVPAGTTFARDAFWIGASTWDDDDCVITSDGYGYYTFEFNNGDVHRRSNQ